MFCAGLLLSIADLLSCELRSFQPASPQALLDRLKSTACSSKPSRCYRNKGGQPRCRNFTGNSPQRTMVCTIRRSAPLFNRELTSPPSELTADTTKSRLSSTQGTPGGTSPASVFVVSLQP